jgi:predicted DNA-binding protein (MmcQ/YjbR family)
MTIEDLQLICKKFNAVTEDIKWEEHLCFNVGAKMFLITAPDQVPPSASFKVTDEDFEMLSSKKGFKPAPHLARYKWIYVEDISLLSKKQWEYYLKRSYELVVAKLTKKIRKQIGIG